MTYSETETWLRALQTALAIGVTAEVQRNTVLPQRIPADGLIILRDGDVAELDTLISPLTYVYERTVDLEILVQDAEDLDAAADVIFREIGAVLVADRTLGGRVDWIEAAPPQIDDLPVEGGATIRAAIVPVRVTYGLTDPLA